MELHLDSESRNISLDDSNNGCDRHCSNCNTTVTPLWRKFGPIKFLCNACGLYYKVNGDHRPYYMSKNKLNSSSKKLMLRCANCGTNKTTMWRKNGGTHVCNACGLYFRINGHNRPVTMRKDIIRTRRRRDTAYDMLELTGGSVGNSSLISPTAAAESGLSCHVDASQNCDHSTTVTTAATAAAAAAAAIILKDIKSEPIDECISSSPAASSSSSPLFDMKSVSSCTSGYLSSFTPNTPHISSPVSSSISSSGILTLPITTVPSTISSSASPLSSSSTSGSSSLCSPSLSSSSLSTSTGKTLLPLALSHGSSSYSTAYSTMMLNISKEQFSISVDFSDSQTENTLSTHAQPLNLNHSSHSMNGQVSSTSLNNSQSLHSSLNSFAHHHSHPLSHTSHNSSSLSHSSSLHSSSHHNALSQSSSFHHHHHHHLPFPVNSSVTHLSHVPHTTSSSSSSSSTDHQSSQSPLSRHNNHFHQLQSLETSLQNTPEHITAHQQQQQQQQQQTQQQNSPVYQLPNTCGRQSAMFTSNGTSSLHHHLESNSVSDNIVPSSSTSPQIVSNNISGCSPTALSTIDMTSPQLLNSSNTSQFDVNNYYCHFF